MKAALGEVKLTHPVRPSGNNSSADIPIRHAAELYLEHCYLTRSRASVKEFADHIGVSPRHLRRVARSSGIDIPALLRAMQMQRAEDLLRRTPYTVGEIAEATAFGTKNTFLRNFAAMHPGVTPEEFRRVSRPKVRF